MASTQTNGSKPAVKNGMDPAKRKALSLAMKRSHRKRKAAAKKAAKLQQAAPLPKPRKARATRGGVAPVKPLWIEMIEQGFALVKAGMALREAGAGD